ncbi:hypothetical protein ACHQM5_004756 [Ranunculus cassubicifolius]
MASKKKESEGIALLSMYNDEESDEDDEMEDAYNNEQHKIESDSIQESNSVESQQSSIPMAEDDSTTQEDDEKILDPVQSDNNLQVSVTSPRASSQLVTEVKKKVFGIVDYGHDETAMSPEAEEGEIGEEDPSEKDKIQGISPPGSVYMQTPNTDATPQLSELPERVQYDSSTTTTTTTYMESETIVVTESVSISVEVQKNVDPLDNFLPSPPKTMCSEELQEKINRFLKFKKLGRSFNDEVRNRKDYRNPDFLLHAVRYQDIDQIGSCFSKDVFDPHGYDKRDFYDELEADIKQEMERKEQERKKSQRIDYVPGGTQVLGITAAQRNPAIPTVPSSGFHSHPLPPSDPIPRSDRPNKKSKWDKVYSYLSLLF